MPVIIEKIIDLQSRIGEKIATSDWVTVSQERINLFADATGDHQWIHIDVERAKHSPFKSTIAHGFLTLSLIPELSANAMSNPSVKMGVNYGLNKVRFTNPVPAGARVRGHFTMKEYQAIPGGAQVTMECTIEIEGQEKPACIAESISRRYE